MVISPLELVQHRRLDVLVLRVPFTRVLVAYAKHDFLLHFILEPLDDGVVRGRFIELECEHFLENSSDAIRNHLVDFLRVLDLQPLQQEVFELVVHVLELLVEVVPRQLVLVEQVNHNVHATLDVVSPRLVVSATTVETCKHKVARELVEKHLRNVGALFVVVRSGQSEVNQINGAWVLVTHQDVLQLQIVVHVPQTMQSS